MGRADDRQILIMSGGQTGVDRAALDVALALGLPTDGWCPAERRAEDGAIPDRYPLRETPTRRWSQRTDWNVRDSDATLVMVVGEPTKGSALTIRRAIARGKPHLVLDVRDADSVARARSWLDSTNVRRLNVAGPRESSAPGIQALAAAILRAILSEEGPG
ncbi:MAG: putative molybdenum carrier protein [Alphaproteobacteria bacterium]